MSIIPFASLLDEAPGQAGAAFVARAKRPLAAFLSGFGLFVILLTLQPFPILDTESDISLDTANIINQVGYLGLGGLYLGAMLALCDRQVLKTLLSPSWAIIFAIAFLSCLQSWNPASATRGLMLSLVVLILVAAVLVLPRSERDFVNAGANAVLLLLVIDYIALVVAPSRSIHLNVGLEATHAGYWKGHLMHKNISAPVFSVLSMFGIYAYRVGLRWRGAAIAALAVIFVLNTGSKTTIGFLPVAVLLVAIGSATRRPSLMILCHVLFTLIIFSLTIGTTWFESFDRFTQEILPDPTFTGRSDIWRFASASIPQHFWVGHGYASFWLSPVIQGLEKDFEANWDVRGIVSGHNSYLDAVLTFGVPGGLTIITLLFVKPFADYLRALKQEVNRPFADFCIMVIVFMTYNGMMESFILNRAEPMWLQTALAVTGLMMMAKLPLRSLP